MGACCGKPKVNRKRKTTLQQLDLADLSEVMQARAHELTNQVMDGPLNNQGLPDFLERRVIEAMIFTVFSTILVVMVGSDQPKKTTL
jgi:hypothetical protein